MRVGADHLLPPSRVHDVSGVSVVDELNGLGLQLLGRVQVSQDQNFTHVLNRQRVAERLLTHHLQKSTSNWVNQSK